MSLAQELRTTTNKVIAERRKKIAQLNAEKAKEQAELARIPKTIQSIVPGIMTELKAEAEDGKRKYVVKYLAARDFSKATNLKKISDKSELRGEAKTLRNYLKRQGLKCTIRRIKARLVRNMGVCDMLYRTVYAELVVKW